MKKQKKPENVLINGPVTHEMILSELKALGQDHGHGGHSLFIGQVRADENDGRKVKAIEYSAYTDMVEKEAGKISETIYAEFNDTRRIRILHSAGKVMAGEISLFVVVSAGHRHHAIAACSRIVELIKHNFPVWKREIFDDDSEAWRENDLFK